jgi:hypothetical protein
LGLGVVVGDGFASSVSLDSGGRESVLPLSHGPDLDNSSVDSATDAVLHFDVEFGDDVSFEGLVFFEILLGGGVNDVTDVETFDGLVLGAVPTAVHAHNGLDVASVIFVATVVSSFDRHVVNTQLNNINPLIKILNNHLHLSSLESSTFSFFQTNVNPFSPPQF